jgi:hypothetical protein
MNLGKGFILTNKFYILIFVPIIFDFMQLEDIMRRAKAGFTLKFTIPSAVPSLTQVLGNPNQGIRNNFMINLPYNNLGSLSLIIFILFILLGAFLKGGFLGCVLTGISDQEVSLNTFIQMGKKYFSRFILQSLIIFLLFMVILPFFFILGPVALFLLICFIILFFFLIFWDYIIVVDNKMIIDAARISYTLVRSNIGKVLSFIIPIAVITALFGIIANVFTGTSPVFAVIAIVIYAYYGTSVVFLMMSFYLESLRNQLHL